MGCGRRFFEPISAVLFVASAAGIGAGLARAKTIIVRPGPCAAQTTYFLAGNSGALIRTDGDAVGSFENHVIVFRRNQTRGWASRHVLKRFDLKLNEKGARILNSGAFCIGAN